MIDHLRWSFKRRARRWASRAASIRHRLGGERGETAAVEPEPIVSVTEGGVSAVPEAVEASAEAPPAVTAEPEVTPEGSMTLDSVQAVLDDLIRPALQSDGGDCTLLKVEDDNVYLKLIGACDGCPSSTITLRMGIETVLKEEFPQMKELIQVDHSF